MAEEKAALLLPAVNQVSEQCPRHAHRNALAAKFWTFITIGAIIWWASPSLYSVAPASLDQGLPRTTAQECAQVDPIFPHQTQELKDMEDLISSPAFEKLSIGRLSGAVQIPTMSFDDLGEIGEDKRWEIMYDFASFLKTTFPLIHSKLGLETINTHGLLYTWKGTDSSLKPTLLMAHQDVVPVPDATVDSWTHPPFSGFFDGKFIWGRGSSDCKNQLIAIMESVESLLAANFTPQRTVLLSFGFDEEISGTEGAGHLAPFILERYGKDGISVIVDEGAGFSTVWGTTMATPGVAEKGYTDVHITIRTPGGHSSIPPPHTGIGIMSELLTLIEAHPYPTVLNDENPYLQQLMCGAEHSPDFPKDLRKLLHSRANQCARQADHLAIEAAKAGRNIQYLMQTSQAIDVISGGVKVNALPERVSAIVNHRINVGEHPVDVHNKVTELAKSVAEKYNLTLQSFDNAKEIDSSITLSESRNTLETAPVTPTEVDRPSPYAILSGTTRALYGKDIIMAPGIMTGNTDTRRYWSSTRHIFRFAPGWTEGENGLGRNIHTVDEKQSVKAHIAAVKWFSLFVRNMDEAKLD